jgi:RNA polymerase sigma factor (TIGR02999 family)
MNQLMMRQILGILEMMNDSARRTSDAVPVVYEELRRLAASHLAREAVGQTLSPTSLVHEAYLRLAATNHWESDRHFFNAAAQAMRRILVDRIRSKRAEKRGGQRLRIDFDQAAHEQPADALDLVALDDALTALASEDALAAELVELRFFVGRTRDQAAQLLDISPRQADRVWAFAKAWLYHRLGEK